MKKVLTKIGYMAFGSLLTLIGYHFGNVDNNDAIAQQALEKSENIINKLRVRQLEIVGNDNSPRIYLSTTPNGGVIRFQDSFGQDKLFLGVDKTESGLSGIIEVPSHNNEPYIRLSKGSYGGRISVNDPIGQDKIVLNVDQSGSGRMVVFGSHSEQAVYIGSGIDAEGNDDGGLVAAYSSNWEDGFAVAGLGVSEEQAFVQVSSKRSKNRMYLVASDDHAIFRMKDDNLRTDMRPGSMTTWNLKTEKPLVSYGLTTLGQGYILTFDENGNQTMPGIIFPPETIKIWLPPPIRGIIVD